MVILLHGLGINANAAIFSAMNGNLLRKIPVENPDQLVRLRRPRNTNTGWSTFQGGGPV
jgi:hypothetical protein